jgi:hypothetical protein
MLRDDWSHLLIIFIGLFLLDILALISLSSVKNWKEKLQRFVRNKYNFTSMIIEITGILIIFISFGLPWFYYEYTGLMSRFIYLPLIEGINMSNILFSFLITLYLIGVITLIINTIVKRDLNIKYSLELIELILLIFGVILSTNVRYRGCNELIHIPEIYCINSGYSIGYFLYLIGLIILISNGIQMCIYSIIHRKKRDLIKNKI